MTIPSAGSRGTAGIVSGLKTGFSPSTPAFDASTSTASAVTPLTSTIHSGARHGSGRYRVRVDCAPAKVKPQINSTTPSASKGKPMPPGAASSSTPYTPIVAAIAPTSVATCARRRRAGAIGARRPYPRLSIDAASSSDRSRAISNTGTAIPRNPLRPRLGRPRRRRASRTRCALTVACGANDNATVTATPSS